MLYSTLFIQNINPERIPIQKAIEINCRVLKIMNNRINSLPHEKNLNCCFYLDKNRGNLELILAESISKNL